MVGAFPVLRRVRSYRMVRSLASHELRAVGSSLGPQGINSEAGQPRPGTRVLRAPKRASTWMAKGATKHSLLRKSISWRKEAEERDRRFRIRRQMQEPLMDPRVDTISNSSLGNDDFELTSSTALDPELSSPKGARGRGKGKSLDCSFWHSCSA